MDIGFIGLGNMGFPMCRRLVEAGHRVIAYDVRSEPLLAISGLGAEPAASPAEVADRSETVLASLPSLDIGRAVVSGENGVTAGKRVRRYVDLSTTGSHMAIETHHILKGRGIVQIDSPVSGGVPGAEKGTLAIMVSGPLAEIETVRPALEVIGRVFVVGEKPGSAQTMKLANNFLSATALGASSEAVAMGVRAGLDAGVMVEVINAGSGRNSATADKFPKSILTGTFDYGFGMALMLKDLRLFMAEAEALGVPTSIAQAVLHLWEAAGEDNGPDSDFTAIARTVEHRAGVEMRSRK